jgi:hypothetical protein
MRNEVVMDELTPFYKPNKKIRSEKIMDYIIPQTKHSRSRHAGNASLLPALIYRR